MATMARSGLAVASLLAPDRGFMDRVTSMDMSTIILTRTMATMATFLSVANMPTATVDFLRRTSTGKATAMHMATSGMGRITMGIDA